eukprot:symbB.v1.2.002555.t1/scaffold136.1/size304296/8
MTLRVPEELPMAPGCLPHATLLCGHGFAPRDANEVLAQATDLGWLDNVPTLTTGTLEVRGSVRRLYIQPLAEAAASGAKPQVKPRRGLNPPISRLQASRCRHFIASSTQPKVTLQRRKEDLNGRHSLSHASKRPRKETPAIPA